MKENILRNYIIVYEKRKVVNTPMIKIVKGDLLESDMDIICHQVNCLGIMGGGLALQIRDKYPEVYDAYKHRCDSISQTKTPELLEEKLLGTNLYVPTANCMYIVANLFGQLDIGCDKRRTDYVAIHRCFHALNNDFKSKKIGIPYGIGCGLGGGDWDKVYGIITKVFQDSTNEITIFKYKKERPEVIFYE